MAAANVREAHVASRDMWCPLHSEGCAEQQPDCGHNVRTLHLQRHALQLACTCDSAAPGGLAHQGNCGLMPTPSSHRQLWSCSLPATQHDPEGRLYW